MAPTWTMIAILAARLIFAAVFMMAAIFKVMDIKVPTGMIAKAGFPLPKLLASLSAVLELGLAIAFLTGAFFFVASLVAGAYIVFLAFAFYGPSHWADNQPELFLFINHFAFVAGLFAAVHGPGTTLALSSASILPRPGQTAQSVAASAQVRAR